MGVREGAQQKIMGGGEFLGVKNFLGGQMKEKWGVEQKKEKVELTAKSIT